MILSELISHGEVDDQMLLNATALIRLEDWDFLESALVSWDNLPAVVLKELQQNTPRNDIWAKFFLRQENGSRAQVDEALRVYYALDPDALAQLDVLAKQPDRIWWSTLAKAISHFSSSAHLTTATHHLQYWRRNQSRVVDCGDE
ncbi:hypothetical protein ACLK1S_08775 [Escherichia coli]